MTPGSPLRASIIIPTFNRAPVLAKCLAAVAQLETDPDLFEIIVIDNNSTDETERVVADHAREHPRLAISRVFEKQQGASFARNSGIKHARAELIGFLDDDAPPSPLWLNALLEAFADPRVGACGGPVILDYQGQARPPWLQGSLQGLLSGYWLPYVQPTPVSNLVEFPHGGNFVFRRNVFDRVGMFRVDIDRIGKELLAGGDTEMLQRVHAAGWQVVYVPAARVRHLVPPERLELKYLYRVGRGLAAAHVLLTLSADPRVTMRWFASDSYFALRMLSAFIYALLTRKRRWFDDYMRFWIVAQRLAHRFAALHSRPSSESGAVTRTPRTDLPRGKRGHGV